MLICASLALPFHNRQLQPFDLLDDHRLRRHPRRIIGRQTAGCLLEVLQAHADVEPYVDGPLLARCFAVL